MQVLPDQEYLESAMQIENINYEHKHTEPYARTGHVSCYVDNYMFIWGGYSEKQILNSDNNRITRICQYMNPYKFWKYFPDIKLWKSCNLKGQILESSGSGAVYDSKFRKLYIIFGCGSTKYINNIFEISVDKKSCQFVDQKRVNKRLPAGRDKFSCCLYDRKIYIFGGHGRNIMEHLHSARVDEFVPNWVDGEETPTGWNDQLLEFNLTDNSWKVIESSGSKPSPRAAHSMALIENTKHAYLFGGRLQLNRLNDLYHLDLHTFIWTKIDIEGSLPCGRSWHTLNAFANVPNHFKNGNTDNNNVDGDSGDDGDHKLILIGGYAHFTRHVHQQRVLDDIWTINIPEYRDRPVKWCKKDGGLPSGGRLWHTTVVSGNGDVLIFGGCNNDIHDGQDIPKYISNLECLRFFPDTLYRLALRHILKDKKIHKNSIHELPKTSSSYIQKIWKTEKIIKMRSSRNHRL